MNKVVLMGRLTKDPEIRYSSASEPMAIARYTLAVNRRFRREGEPDADFINCKAFGKAAEFAERWFKKGMMVAVSGRLEIRSFDNEQGQRQWFTEVILDDQHFAESRASFENRQQQGQGHSGHSGHSGQYDSGQYSQPPQQYGQPQQYSPPPPPQRPPQQSHAAPPPPSDTFFEIDTDVSDDDLPF